jgi:hypothetical protein
MTYRQPKGNPNKKYTEPDGPAGQQNSFLLAYVLPQGFVEHDADAGGEI